MGTSSCISMHISSVIKSISIHHWMSSSSVVFNRISGDQAALQQFSYILANLLGLAMAMYKCHTMGLLPTSQSDWVEFMDQQQVLVYLLGVLDYKMYLSRFWNFLPVESLYHDLKNSIFLCIKVCTFTLFLIIVTIIIVTLIFW